MSDLSDLQSAQTIKVAGSNSSGSETNFLSVDPNGAAVTRYSEPATYSIISVATPIAFNKSMMLLGNATASNKIKLHKIQIINVQTTNVNGIFATFEMRRVTSTSGGTNLTPFPFDTSSVLPSGVLCNTNATVSAESAIVKRWIWSSDELVVNTSDEEGLDHTFQTLQYVYNSEGKTSPIIININEGIHIKQTTNSAIGTFDIYMEFTVES